MAEKIVQLIPWQEVQIIAELDFGTGTLTHFIELNRTEGSKVFLFNGIET
ncbi:hypothetical protein [Paenibacillus antibioticophila]|nr:hypothetical protein [Paenibacillus antibioticophila]